MDSQTSDNTAPSTTHYRPLRTWIPLLILPCMVLARFIPDWVENGPANIWMVSAFGPMLLSLLILLWWALVSRARWFERLLGILGIVIVVVAEQVLCDHSLRGPLLIVMTVPMTIAGFAIGSILFGKQLKSSRTVLALLFAALAASFSLFFKSDGVWGDFSFGLQPRWEKSAEDALLADIGQRDAAVSNVPVDEFAVEVWPRFRGVNQDGTQSGRTFGSNWKSNPPRELWRISVGPAWSSFVATANFLFTQEQRGDEECVVCYDARNGQQVWVSSVPSRFFEGLGGLGPRATPTLDGQDLYTLGAEGWLQKINASNGEVAWKVDLREQAEREPPMWGFSCSPVVVDGLVVVHAGGKGDNGVLAFRTSDGSLGWKAAAGEMSYGSLQVIEVLGRRRLALLSDEGVHIWEILNGKSELAYQWKHNGYRALQPRMIGMERMLVATGTGTGTRLIKFELADNDTLAANEVWTSLDLKPDFNDFVVIDDHIYGFDNRIFACLELETGKRKWKGGRYEKGQAVLLADSKLIVVVGEKGELVLLKASPERLEELAKLPALDDKTWNHPILVGNKLILRNAKEAVCYELPSAP